MAGKLISLALAGALATPAMADSLWQGKDSLYLLQADGSSRRFVVAQAGASAQGQGWQAGDILFEGARDGSAYIGTLYAAGGRCAQQVRGRVPSELTVVIDAPADIACDGAISGPLELRYLGDADAAALTAIASQPAEMAEPAPAAEPAPPVEPPTTDPDETTSTVDVTAPAEPQSLGVVAPVACDAEAQDKGLSLAACEGILAGLRLAGGADPAAETARFDRILQAGGSPRLRRVVDSACYSGASLTDHANGLEVASAQPAMAEGLRLLCLRMLTTASALSPQDQVSLAGGNLGPISGAIWVEGTAGGPCKGNKVLRLTSQGLFQGRYGAEAAAPNILVTEWSETDTSVVARMEIYSEIVTAPDVVLSVSAALSDGFLDLTIDRQRVTAESRYTKEPAYATDRIEGRYTTCTP